jgi:hypothetical protein
LYIALPPLPAFPSSLLPPFVDPSVFTPIPFTTLAVAQPITWTTTEFVGTLGGGITVLTRPHWSMDIDARYVGFFGNRERHPGRYGGGVTYRF